MFFRILKKDLRRKKTMNIILLLFVIISSMFAASSVNNIVSVVNGIDYYFDKAGMSDYSILAMDRNGVDTISPMLDSASSVDGYKRERVIYLYKNGVLLNGEGRLDFSNAAMLMSVDRAKLNFFTEDNKKLESVKKGKVYISANTYYNSDLKEGDVLDIKVGEASFRFEVAGLVKDALLGSTFMSNPRFIINEEDFKLYENDPSTVNYAGGIFYIDTAQPDSVKNAITESSSILFDGDKEMMHTTYIMEIIVAAMIMIVGIFLILISFVVLRFTIRFTLTEEFREIGVMKAIGIKNRSIRKLYLTKYLGISVVGAVIGYFLSIPFGNMMLQSATKTMVLGNDSNFLLSILSSAAVVVIILLFCYGCTRRVNKLSPIDAVRSGQTGERFCKRSLLSLSKSRLGAQSFLPANDVVSAPKQYTIITLIFTVCLLLIMILANTANTLRSEKLLFLFGTTESDLFITDHSYSMDIMGGTKTIDECNKDIEKILADNGMPGKVHFEAWFQIPTEAKGIRENVIYLYCRDTKCSDYVYQKGTPPQNKNEIAFSPLTAKKFGVDIGDKVKLKINGKTEEYLITALFQNMDQVGSVCRLHEDVELIDREMSSAFPFQVDFDDHPDKDTIEERKEKLKDILNIEEIFNTAEFVNETTGVSDTIAAVKDLVLIISIVIIVMIAVLIERSFITKEKAEIALMKALGFKDRAIIRQHASRFAICAVISGIIAAAICLPITKLSIDPIFGIMGASEGVEYLIKPVEVFVIYPIAVLASAVAGAALTAFYTKTIKASDTSNIE